MNSIKISYDELLKELYKMKQMENTSDYLIRESIYSFINVGKGDMFKEINGLYLKLNEFEKVLRNVIETNNKLLEKAGFDFNEAERIIAKNVEEIK